MAIRILSQRCVPSTFQRGMRTFARQFVRGSPRLPGGPEEDIRVPFQLDCVTQRILAPPARKMFLLIKYLLKVI